MCRCARRSSWLGRGWDDLTHIGGAGLAHGALIAVLGGGAADARQQPRVPHGRGGHGISAGRPGDDHRVCASSPAGAKRTCLLGFDESLQALTRNPEGLMHFGGVLALVALLWFVLSAILLESVLSASVPSLAVALWGGAAPLERRRRCWATSAVARCSP